MKKKKFKRIESLMCLAVEMMGQAVAQKFGSKLCKCPFCQAERMAKNGD